MWTVNTIRDAVRASGSHWFDPDTMLAFGTVILPTVYQGPGGIFFITLDNQYDRELPKRSTVRRFTPPDDIGTADELGEHATKEAAMKAARAAADGNYKPEGVVAESIEEYRPITILEQFAHDLQKHLQKHTDRGTETETLTAAETMIGMARKHHRYMEMLCNGELELDAEGDSPTVDRLRGRMKEIAAKVGASGVIFSGDPRGCTAKLVFADGYTNDSVREGYCIPTENDA